MCIRDRYFPISDDDDVFKLLDRTHINLFSLFMVFTKNLKQFGKGYIEKKCVENKGLTWSAVKRTSKDIENYRLIDKDIDETEFLKRVKSFNYLDYPIELKLHGKTFSLSKG